MHAQCEYPVRCKNCGTVCGQYDSLACLCWACGYPHSWVTTNAHAVRTRCTHKLESRDCRVCSAEFYVCPKCLPNDWTCGSLRCERHNEKGQR